MTPDTKETASEVIGLLIFAAVLVCAALMFTGCKTCTPCRTDYKIVSAREAKAMKALGMDVRCTEDREP